jgi:hypothetical protein
MIPFIFGAFFGGAIILAGVSLVLDISNSSFHDIEDNSDPWEEQEFWDDYHRNI